MEDQTRQATLVRNARQEDLDALVELWVELTDFHRQLDSYYTARADANQKMAEYFAKQIDSDRAVVLVAEVDHAIAGYLMADIAHPPPVFEGPDYVMITDTCVRASVRRRGVGAKLVTTLMSVARERRIERVDVGYAACNALSTAFWTKMGFEPFSIRARYGPA